MERGASSNEKSPRPVLLVDDSEADIYFLKKALFAAGVRNPISVVRNGREAIQFLKGRKAHSSSSEDALPGIVLLDLRMPVLDGFEVLKWKATRPEFSVILWVALSNSDSIADVNLAYQLGAHTFLSKPLHKEDVLHLVEGFQSYWSIPNVRNLSSGAA